MASGTATAATAHPHDCSRCGQVAVDHRQQPGGCRAKTRRSGNFTAHLRDRRPNFQHDPTCAASSRATPDGRGLQYADGTRVLPRRRHLVVLTDLQIPATEGRGPASHQQPQGPKEFSSNSARRKASTVWRCSPPCRIGPPTDSPHEVFDRDGALLALPGAPRRLTIDRYARRGWPAVPVSRQGARVPVSGSRLRPARSGVIEKVLAAKMDLLWDLGFVPRVHVSAQRYRTRLGRIIP